MVSANFAVLVSLGLATTAALLVVTFLLGIGGALSAPAWQAITSLLVLRQDLDGAISANSVGYSLSRAVGPALGGVVIASLGISMPFWVFLASTTICNIGNRRATRPMAEGSLKARSGVVGPLIRKTGVSQSSNAS